MNKTFTITGIALIAASSQAAVVNYEDLTEGFLGTSMTHQGIQYRDVNNVSGFYADGTAFSNGEPGTQLIIENAGLFYNDFPGYGSPVNSLTFGNSFIGGENLTIGALASVYMDFVGTGTVSSASLDIAYYELGPWGDIQYHLDALQNGTVVASDSFTIPGSEGRDAPTYRNLSVSAAEFNGLHLYATKNGSYTVPRGMIDNLTYTAVPEPGTVAALGLGIVALARRRRR